MKVLRLDLIAFGPFADLTLDLSAGRHGLHLIYGPNEAGKSSALRALRQALFGIDEKTTDKFKLEYEQLRVGGHLLGRDGSELEFVRRKGRKRVLTGPDGAELDDSAVARMLGGLDAERFGRLYGLDHAGLVAGGRAILEGGGDLGELLFGSGTDLAGLVALRRKLETKAGDLFKGQGRVPTLNRELAEFEAARKAIESASLKGADWLALRGRLEALGRERAEADTALAGAGRARARLERIGQALPDVGRHRELSADLAALADAPRLRPEFADERRRAESGRDEARRRAERAEAEAAELAEAPDDAADPGPWLAEASAIDDLRRRLGAHQQAAEDAARDRAALGPSRARLGSLARELGLPDDAAAIEATRVPQQQKGRVQNLAADFYALRPECESLGKQIDRLAAELAALDARSEGLPPARDAGPLRASARRVRSRGDLEAALREAAARRDALESRAADELARLGLAAPSPEAAARLPVPSVDRIEPHRRDLEAADRLADDLAARRDEAAAGLARVAAEAERLRQGREVPTEEDLRAARARRDLAWKLVKAEWKGPPGDPEVARALAGFGGGDPAATFERRLAEADEVADRLRFEADRAAALIRLDLDRRRAESDLADLDARLAEARAERSRRQGRWAELWRPCGLEPGTPADMIALSRGHVNLVDSVESLREAGAAALARAAEVESARGELAEALREAGEPPGPAGESLAARLDRAEDAAAAIEAVEAVRADLARQRERLATERDQARAAEAEARRQLAELQAAWAAAVAPLGLPAEASPEEATATLGRFEALAAEADAVTACAARLAAFDARAAAFDAAVADLAGRLDPAAGDEPAATRIERLGARLAEARAAEARRAERRERSAKLAETIRQARADAEEAAARLAALCREAGVSSPEDLPAAEARAEARLRLEDELGAVGDRLRVHAGGRPLSEFLAEAGRADPDAIPDEVARLGDEAAARLARLGEIDQARGAARQELEQMEETAREAQADRAAHEAQGLLTRIEADATRYLRYRLASAVLRQAIERYRERSQGPVLRRASDLFARLTCGSFAGLRADCDEDGATLLLGERPSGETLGVEGMSEGTCDQLYLALKLASLEHDLDGRAEPPPLVADDLLVHFDDDRATAALRVLADLSRRTQVIFFTHHQHLVDLAEKTLAPDVLINHNLRGAAVPA